MLRRSCFRSEKQHSLRSIFHGVYPEKAINNGVWQMCSELVVLVRMCPLLLQGRIQPVRWGGTISVIVGSQVSLRAHYCKRDEAYFTTLRCLNNGRQNGLISLMFFPEFYKIMVNNDPFVSFRGGDRPNRPPLDPPLLMGSLSPSLSTGLHIKRKKVVWFWCLTPIFTPYVIYSSHLENL